MQCHLSMLVDLHPNCSLLVIIGSIPTYIECNLFVKLINFYTQIYTHLHSYQYGSED